jgi:hypothetical protein
MVQYRCCFRQAQSPTPSTRTFPSVELHLTTGRELFEADFVYLMTKRPL